MDTHHPANPRSVLYALLCVAGFALAGALAHADEHESNVPELPAPPPNTYGSPADVDSTGGAAALAGTGRLDTALEATDGLDTDALAAALERAIAQMTPEERESFKRLLNREMSDMIQLTVSVKDNDAKCFLEQGDWASCFEGLPPEPEWSTTNVPELPMSNFWQLRSLWTKTPVERLE